MVLLESHPLIHWNLIQQITLLWAPKMIERALAFIFLLQYRTFDEFKDSMNWCTSITLWVQWFILQTSEELTIHKCFLYLTKPLLSYTIQKHLRSMLYQATNSRNLCSMFVEFISGYLSSSFNLYCTSFRGAVFI